MKLLLAAVLAAAVPAPAADPVFGSFTLDTAASQTAASCAALMLDDLGNGKFDLAAVRIVPGAAPLHQDGIFAFDGADHLDGNGGTLAFTRIDAQRYAMVTKSQAGDRITTIYTLAGDTLAASAIGVAGGRPFRETLVLQRGGAGCRDN